jgi:hypothetical protein
MTTPRITDIQVGWRVFAGSEEIGEVTQVDADALDVERGRLRHRQYRFPRNLIREANDGVVDLDVDPGTVDTFESAPSSDPGQLPNEYRRLEYGEDVPEPRVPIDTYPTLK